MPLPPLSDGAAHDRDSCPSPGATLRLLGAVGIVLGLPVVYAHSKSCPSTELSALTRTSYVTPFSRSVIVSVTVFLSAVVCSPGESQLFTLSRFHCTTKFSISAPPVSVGDSHDTSSCWLPSSAVNSVGAPGIDIGVPVVSAQL